MSKLRVRTSFGDNVKPVELTRGDAANYNVLRDEVASRHDLKAFQLKYMSNSLGDIMVTDADSFMRVLKDVEFRQMPHIELKVLTGEKQAPVAKSTGISTPTKPAYTSSNSFTSSSPSASTPSSSNNSSHSNPSTPQHSQPSHNSYSSPSPTSPSAAGPSATGTIHSFLLPGDPSSANPDKVSVKANQEDDFFLFVPQAAKYNSEVNVVLEGNKLSFLSTTKHPDGRIFQFTQGFSLPFSTIPANTIHIMGYNIKITF